MRRAACWVAIVLLPALGSCGGGGSGGAGAGLHGGPFLVLETEPPDHGLVYLNDPVRIVFSHAVDLATANFNTVTFDAFDLATGQPRAEEVVGTFHHGQGENGPAWHVLEFHPRFPTNDTFDNGGFRPGRRYSVSLVTSPARTAAVLRDQRGRALAEALPFSFRTPGGRSPAELFRNPKAGGPRRVRMEVNPSGTDPSGRIVAPLNLLSRDPLEVRLVFDQALNPSSSNLPLQSDPNPLLRGGRTRGRIFLEYDDPQLGPGRWIPALLDLEVNSPAGAEVVLRPDAVLPNNAEVRAIVEADLEDIAGESNRRAAGYNRIFGRFRTVEGYESRFDAVVARFRDTGLLDRAAPFLDPPADAREGWLSASFAFEGSQTLLDFEPFTQEVVLNTDFTQVTPRNAPPISVAGGVFQFRDVHIPEGVTVRGIGSRPMVWLVTGEFRVDGHLSVDGGDGSHTNTVNSANIPAPGGSGHCGGGHGGTASYETARTTPQGESGFGPGNRPRGGGEGGRTGCSGGRGAGGGGGSNATAGDPLYHRFVGSSLAPFPQMRGDGGDGTGTNPTGGRAGPVRDADGRPENNFTGTTVDLFRNERIEGEYAVPMGGAGGGGGGDSTATASCQAGTGFFADNKGGGGGGGAGVLIVKALGPIVVGPGGRITAEGGRGGGGAFVGTNSRGGGGGGGAGGTIILMSGSEIVLHVKGETYFERDTGFSISADGGYNLTSGARSKYPAGTTHNQTGQGGFGGMGVVQLMAPPGAPPSEGGNADETNTILDDNIHLMGPGGPLTGRDKQRFLAWSGMDGKDDFGQDVPDYGGGGDIRPRPHLLPAPFGRYSRARTRWIWTGATDRRPLAAPDGAARGLVVRPGLEEGPEYFFDGTITAAARSGEAGYLAYDPTNGTLRPVVVLPDPTEPRPEPVRVVSMQPLGILHEGSRLHVVQVEGGRLGGVADRYANHRAVLRDHHGKAVADLRIVAHTGNELYLDPAEGFLPEGARTVEVVARFFEVRTGGTPGLGPAYAPDPRVPGRRVPVANVQIGFAFHKDPLFPDPDPGRPGTDRSRFPRELGRFLFDLRDEAVREELRALRFPYVRMDVRFNIDYTDDQPSARPGHHPPGPLSPVPELSFLLLPYRF